MLLRPPVERDRCQFVNQGVGQAIFREVNGFNVGAADVAALDAHVRKLLGSVNRKLGLVLLAASGTQDTAEFPLAKTEPADQIPARTVAQWTQDGNGGSAVAEWAARVCVTVRSR